MQNTPIYTLEEFSKEDAAKIDAEIKAVLDKHDATFNIHRFIDAEGKIQAAVGIYKKVEEAVKSPFIVNGESNPAQDISKA